MIRDPKEALASIQADLEAGGEPQVMLGLLDAVEAILEIRGVDRSTQLAALRKAIQARVGTPPAA